MVGETNSSGGRSSQLAGPDDLEFTADDFFEQPDIDPIVGQEDLEQIVSDSEKPVYREVDRYWLNDGYSFCVIYLSLREDEYQYVVVEPVLSEAEKELLEVLREKLRESLDPDDLNIRGYRNQDREKYLKEQRKTIREETYSVMKNTGLVRDEQSMSIFRKLITEIAGAIASWRSREIDPELAPLSEEQERKLTYYLIRDFVGFERIDPIMQDAALEDIHCPGYDSEVFVEHKRYGHISTNVRFGTTDLDDFVMSLSQRAGGDLSISNPQLDETLDDGSRIQIDYQEEVSPDGSNFTIRKFDTVPRTPIDLINWGTFDIDITSYLWLLIENGKSVLFSGGTGAGKTTSMNAFSMCIGPSNKITSIEDTREVELPHKDHVPNVVRNGADDDSDIDHFQLLTSNLRKRPNYIVVGEVRGQEARVLLQTAATGHTVASTFHAANPAEVIERFTSDPLNASVALLKSLDVIVTQNVTDKENNIRRCTHVVELEPENIEVESSVEESGGLNPELIFKYDRGSDGFRRVDGDYSDGLLELLSSKLEDVMKQNSWDEEDLKRELQRRKTVLAYLVNQNLNSYKQVAATLQAYMNSKDAVLALIANGELEEKIPNLTQMKNVDIDVDPEMEQQVPRPRPDTELKAQTEQVLARAREEILPEFEGIDPRLARPPEEGIVPGEEIEEDETVEEVIAEASPEMADMAAKEGTIDSSLVDEGDDSDEDRIEDDASISLDEELRETIGDPDPDDPGSEPSEPESVEASEAPEPTDPPQDQGSAAAPEASEGQGSVETPEDQGSVDAREESAWTDSAAKSSPNVEPGDTEPSEEEAAEEALQEYLDDIATEQGDSTTVEEAIEAETRIESGSTEPVEEDAVVDALDEVMCELDVEESEREARKALTKMARANEEESVDEALGEVMEELGVSDPDATASEALERLNEATEEAVVEDVVDEFSDDIGTGKTEDRTAESEEELTESDDDAQNSGEDDEGDGSVFEPIEAPNTRE